MSLKCLHQVAFKLAGPLTVFHSLMLTIFLTKKLTHWQLIIKYVKCIWKYWSIDCLNLLKQHGKWQIKKEHIKLGSLILMKDEYLPPCRWALAKIIEVIPGKDNMVHTVKVKTATGTFLWGISKIYLLPNHDDLINVYAILYLNILFQSTYTDWFIYWVFCILISFVLLISYLLYYVY